MRALKPCPRNSSSRAASRIPTAARKLVEIANATEAVQDGRIYIELVNGSFLEEGGTPDQFHAALTRATKLGWLWLHESGTYVKFTPAGAELFA